jgi:hypothetical protein
MVALLAANPYLGIGEVDYELLEFLGLFIVGLAAILLLLRGVGILRQRAQDKQARWDIFRQMARARGLSKEQIAVLAFIAGQARIKSPARLLGSIQLFDRALERTVSRVDLTDKQSILANAIRTKLSTAKELWTESDGERRQMTRVRCSWNVRLEMVSEKAINKQVFRTGDSSDKQLLETTLSLIEAGNFLRHRAQISDISSGGVSLLASPKFKGSTGDIARFKADSKRIPFAIDGLCGQLLNIEQDDERGLQILHMKFLPMDTEIRKAIIQFVYEKVDPANAEKDPKKRPLVTDRPAQ